MLQNARPPLQKLGGGRGGRREHGFFPGMQAMLSTRYPIIEDAHLETVEANVDTGMLDEAPEEGDSSSDA